MDDSGIDLLMLMAEEALKEQIYMTLPGTEAQHKGDKRLVESSPVLPSQCKRCKLDQDLPSDESQLDVDWMTDEEYIRRMCCSETDGDWVALDPEVDIDQSQLQCVSPTTIFINSQNTGFEDYSLETYIHRRSIELNYHPIASLECQPQECDHRREEADVTVKWVLDWAPVSEDEALRTPRPQVTPCMRGVLVDWIVKVHHNFNLFRDSLFLAINIIDRFLVTTPISRDCFQLLGITALLIASKQEDIYPPEINELLRLCGDSYNRDQVKQLELIILRRLHFDLLAPTAYFFLQYHTTARLQSTDKTGCTYTDVLNSASIASLLLEQSMQEYSLCQFIPSLLALASLEIADEINGKRTRLEPMYCGGYAQEEMQECIDDMRPLATAMVDNFDDVQLSSVFQDYLRLYLQGDEPTPSTVL